MKLNPLSEFRLSLLFGLGVVVIYLALFLFYDGLRFPLIWDENHFWATTLLFSQHLIPSFALLQDYGQLNTPLPFMLFGWLERWTGDGIFAGRLLNFILSICITCLIGLAGKNKLKNSVLAACGLIVFPYYLWLSTHLYTDIIAAFFVLVGVWLYLQNRYILSSLAFILAIAARQFMLAFPVAIVAYELWVALRAALAANSVQARVEIIRQSAIRWLTPLVAASTILGWFWLFGGLAPSSGIAVRPTPDVQQETWAIALNSSLYFLACVGLYFVIPEWILFSRKWNITALITRRNLCLIFSLLVLFILFPPNIAHGLLIKLARLLPLELLKDLLLYGLALLAAIRFSRLNLEGFLLLANCGLMLKAFPWDKYVLPLLIVLWYLKSINRLPVSPKQQLSHQMD
jgi:hypothetical protein